MKLDFDKASKEMNKETNPIGSAVRQLKVGVMEDYDKNSP
jgi:hypothetical protein